MSFGPNLESPWFKETLPIATYRHKIPVAGRSDYGFQWVLPGVPAGSPATTISIYSSVLPWDHPDLTDLDPSTNPFWTLEPNAAFPSLPDDTANSAVLTLEAQPFGTLLIELGVTVQMANFSFLIRGQERG